MKTYDYKGILVQVEEDAKYIGIGKNGIIQSFRNKPGINSEGEFDATDTIPLIVLNAPKTLIDVSLLKVFAPLVLSETVAPGTAPFKKGDKYIIRSSVNEEDCINSEVHIVVNCYTPGIAPWTQVIHVHVNGLSTENQLLSNVVEILHELHAV